MPIGILMVSPATAGNEIAEAVTGNNLTVTHATGNGYVPCQPRTDLHIDENSNPGTVVGYFVPHVASQNSNLAYDPLTNKFYLAASAQLDWQQAQSYAINTKLNGVPGRLPTVYSLLN